ncbi:hypothetical protein [Streptomyces aureus]|uniref:hypothetical protein n=1 Tax=Streptomyces aureus TaxID=193461 RepID=UPI00369B97ED
MADRRWDMARDIAVGSVAFLVGLGASWAVCGWIGHPEGDGNRWALCIGFATVVATAVGTAAHRRIAGRERSGPTAVTGHHNRVAGAGAHDNDFGDHLPPAEPARPTTPASPVPAPDPAGGAASDGEVRVHGERNRVAGPNASHNRFGDGAPPGGDGRRSAPGSTPGQT